MISDSELFRLEAMSQCEKRLKAEGFVKIAGIDEAGRGPLAGPVVAAACILPEGALFENLNDSKQLSAEEREELFAKITVHPGLIYGVGIIDVKTIDRVNILQATFLAMRKAVKALSEKPDYLLIDGNQSPHFDIPTESIVEGDALSISIAAASIIAKVTRDLMMHELDAKYPKYGFKQHKGYATDQHLEAIKAHGPCPIHRKSFDPVKSMLTPIQLDLIQSIQDDVKKIGRGKPSDGKPQKRRKAKRAGEEIEKGEKPKDTSERTDDGHMRDASMPKEETVGAKGEGEKTFEGKEFGFVSNIEVGVEE